MTFRQYSRRSFALLCVTAGLAVTGCANEEPTNIEGKQTFMDRAPIASEEEIAASKTATEIRDRGQMLIGGDLNLPLISQRNPTTGQTEGFDATLSRMLAKYITGRPTPKTVPVSPENREQLLQAGTVDAVIRIYSITEQRAKQVTFAGPYFDSGQTIATLRSDNEIHSSDDLSGKRVAVVGDTTSQKALKEAVPDAQISVLPDSALCVQAVEKGDVDAYVHDLAVVASSAMLNNKIKIAGKPFTSEPYGIGIQHGDESFKRFINNWLRKIERSGLWSQAWQQSLGTVVADAPPKPPEIGSVPGT